MTTITGQTISISGIIAPPPSISYLISRPAETNADPTAENLDLVTGSFTLTDEQWAAWFHPPTESFISKCLAENLGIEISSAP